MDHEYWTYIVASLSGTLYTGVTNNIERRIWEHKSGEFAGFARKYRCDRLVYYESLDDILKAIDREKQLKGGVDRRRLPSYNRAIRVGPIWPKNGDGRWRFRESIKGR